MCAVLRGAGLGSAERHPDRGGAGARVAEDFVGAAGEFDPVIVRGEQIVAIPTLVRSLPVPIRRIVGDLSKIEAGKVDVVVVYKIDRLTRSLGDFARIVDVLVFTSHKAMISSQLGWRCAPSARSG